MSSSISLADTCADAFEAFSPSSVEPGRGCLLQIYPATSRSELMRLTAESVTIGRDHGCDITISDQAMSRAHAVIEQRQGNYFLSDLGSTNGTWLNDKAVRGRVALNGGELIRMGGSILKFMSAMDEEANYHAVVHELMTRDSLTNAFNRSYLIPLIETEISRCRSQSAMFSLILLDIDHFKRINDRHGHLVGDEVLRIFCERIRRELRTNDMLARFGGEEFVIACSRTGLVDARHLAERVRLSISSERFQTHAGLIDVTCSMGVCSTDGSSFPSCDLLLTCADQQLYAAKKAGRNRVQAYESRH
ncbi:MAG: GGDEF domain-containing protein [Planctomycetaceae bacterium]